MTLDQHRFIEHAAQRLARDERVAAVLIAGSLRHGGDAYSDVDLVLVWSDDAYPERPEERRVVARSLGDLLACFTGEHVGEPRLLICLYGPHPLHVDLKFIRVTDAFQVADSRVAFLRSPDVLTGARTGAFDEDERDAQWYEDRFWIWTHYAWLKVGRGELYEAIDTLAFLRSQVWAPMLARRAGERPRGVRHLEALEARTGVSLAGTLASHSRGSCADALDEGVRLYLTLRADHLPPRPLKEAQEAVQSFASRLRQAPGA